MLAVYTMTVWPVVANQVSACSPARTLALANLIYIAEVLFFVWTVAYNFVPGGVYTREHTDWLIAIVMIFILLGIKSGLIFILILLLFGQYMVVELENLKSTLGFNKHL